MGTDIILERKYGGYRECTLQKWDLAPHGHTVRGAGNSIDGAGRSGDVRRTESVGQGNLKYHGEGGSGPAEVLNAMGGV